METSMIGGATQAFGRLLSGASMMLVTFTNTGDDGLGELVLGPNFYSKLIPVDLKEYGHSIVCRKDSFVVGPTDTAVDVHVIRSFLSLIGGEGILLQKISGSGTVLLKASGAVQSVYLSAGESMLLHPGALVAYEHTTVTYEVQPVAGAKNIFFGQGMFLVKVTGPGKIILQTMSETKFAQSLHLTAGSSFGLIDALLIHDVLSHPSPSGEAVTPPEDPSAEGTTEEQAKSPDEEVGEPIETQPNDEATEPQGEEPQADKWADEGYSGGGQEEGGTWLSEAVEFIKNLFDSS